MSDISKKIEAILFLKGEPMSLSRLALFLKVKEDLVNRGIKELEESLQSRGLAIVKKDGEFMMASAPELAKFTADFAKDEIGQDLSRAVLETLAIIVYKGPLTRSEIDYIRAVNSSFTVRNLMIRGLIERVSDPKDARAWLYRPTFEFLKFVGIGEIKKLPDFEEFRTEMENLRKSEKNGEKNNG